jgi:hypothetical protein
MKTLSAFVLFCLPSVAVHTASAQVTEDFKLIASDAAAGDNFGSSVGISGTTAIVGAIFDDDAGSASGSAYIFNTTTGGERLKLTASDATEGDRFGDSAAISGGTAIVGAPGDLFGVSSTSGSAYIFNAANGQQLFKLTVPDAAAVDNFGWSVAISGSIAIVGVPNDDDAGSASGSAYLFDSTTGRRLFKLTAFDAAAGDNFGWSVAISGTTAIVGARRDDDDGFESGSAYLFNTTTGQQLFKLTASDAGELDQFGSSVAISGTTAIVGAPNHAEAGLPSGSAYVFDTTTGRQLLKLTASDAALNDNFGDPVALSGSTAIIGARGNSDAGLSSGSAYMFDATTGQQLFKLTASDAAAGDFLGSSVAISAATLVAGAYLDGPESGSVYVYHLSSSPCPGDIADDFGTLGGDGMVSFGDFLALLGLIGPCPGGTVGCTGDIADDFGTLGGDAQVSFGDFLALLGLIGPCP